MLHKVGEEDLKGHTTDVTSGGGFRNFHRTQKSEYNAMNSGKHTINSGKITDGFKMMSQTGDIKI